MPESTDASMRVADTTQHLHLVARRIPALVAVAAALFTLLVCARTATLGALAAHSESGSRVIATLHTGRRPEPLIADRSRQRVYIGNESSGTVTVLAERTNRPIATIRVGHEVEDLALDPLTERLYVANGNSASVSVVDTNRLRVVATIHVGKAPGGVAVDGARHVLYVANTASNTVSVVDTGRARVVHTLSVPGKPQGIGVDPSLNRVFVALEGRGRVLAIDGSSYDVLARMRVGRLPLHPLRIDVATHGVFVLSSGSSTLSIINGRTMRVVRTIPTAANPEGLDLSPGSPRAYVANEGDPGTDRNSGNTVSVIDLRASRIIDTVRVLKGPDGVAYDPATGRLYVCDETPSAISVVALPSEDR